MSAFFVRVFKFVCDIPIYIWIFLASIGLYIGIIILISYLEDKQEAKDKTK